MTAGSSRRLRTRWRNAACTVDFASPVRVAMVCRLTETRSFTPEGHEGRIGSFFNGAFACDDVAATYRQLKSRGVEFVSEPQQQPWGTFAIFKDPDGNQFVLSSS